MQACFLFHFSQVCSRPSWRLHGSQDVPRTVQDGTKTPQDASRCPKKPRRKKMPHDAADKRLGAPLELQVAPTSPPQTLNISETYFSEKGFLRNIFCEFSGNYFPETVFRKTLSESDFFAENILRILPKMILNMIKHNLKRYPKLTC